MKQYVGALVICLAIPFFGLSQGFDNEAFNSERLRLNKVGMTILGSWAVGNMAVSALSLNGASAEAKAFHQMNIGWNTVNLAIAGLGYYGALSGETNLSMLESIRESEKMTRILLFNAGLDIGYMAGGFYLIERGKNQAGKREQFSGFGKSVIMNGAFLFTFDVIMAYLHSHHASEMLYSVASVVRPTSQGLALTLRF